MPQGVGYALMPGQQDPNAPIPQLNPMLAQVALRNPDLAARYMAAQGQRPPTPQPKPEMQGPPQPQAGGPQAEASTPQGGGLGQALMGMQAMQAPRQQMAPAASPAASGLGSPDIATLVQLMQGPQRQMVPPLGAFLAGQ